MKTTTKKPFYKILYVQVIAAITLGVILGHFYPDVGASMKPFGDAFVKLIKLIIAPIIFLTVVLGIAGMDNLKKVGKTGGIALLYFEIVSTFALILGLLVANILQTGNGMHINASTLDPASVATYADPHKMGTTVDYLMNIIPASFVEAFSKGDILQVLFLALIVGFALQRTGGKDGVVFKFLENLNTTVFDIVNFIMKFAPIGAFGAMAFTIGKYGVGSLVSLGELMATFYLTCVLFVVVVLGTIAKISGFSIFKFIRYIKDELLLVLGTSSSESALPGIMKKLERLGVSKSTVGLVIPSGYSFNLDGSAIYFTLAALFLAHATDTPMSLVQQITLLGVLLLTSKGASGVTGSGFIVLAATLSVVGHVPVVALTLILGIDRFMSEARALTNLVGNGVATVVVGKITGELDTTQLNKELNNQ